MGDGEGNRCGFLGVDGEEWAEEGGLSGNIISGFVRVGDGGAIGTRGIGRICILNGYGALTCFRGIVLPTSCMPISAIITKRLKHSRVRQRNKLHDAKMADRTLRDCRDDEIVIYIYRSRI